MPEGGMVYVVSIRGIVKIAEAILIVITMGLWYGIAYGWPLFVTGTIMTSVYTTFALAAQNIILGPSRVAELLLYGLSTLFLVISAIVIFAKVSYSSTAIACGVCCIIAGLLYAADIFLTLKFTEDP
ncbi:uncharacterized protein [Macrobrachium rosenbergii]|uniref:uncharacterized protein n=1 Tax=Macrobrachium rosenbergii TaxID=79674 RepID=UPI0034D4AAD4